MPLQNRVTPFGAVHRHAGAGHAAGQSGLVARPGKADQARVAAHAVDLLRARIQGAASRGYESWPLYRVVLPRRSHESGGGPSSVRRMQATRYNEFRDAWAAGNPDVLTSERLSAVQIDLVLHAERLLGKRLKRTFGLNLVTCPTASSPRWQGMPDQAFLIQGDSLLAWSAGGYRRRDDDERESSHRCSRRHPLWRRSGQVLPEIHPSAHLV